MSTFKNVQFTVAPFLTLRTLPHVSVRLFSLCLVLPQPHIHLATLTCAMGMVRTLTAGPQNGSGGRERRQKVRAEAVQGGTHRHGSSKDTA